jgi:hypothetical protein
MDTRQRARQVGQEHQTPTAKPGVEGGLGQVRGLGIHFSELYVRQAQMVCPLPRDAQHLRRLVCADDPARGADPAGCGKTWLTDAGRYVQHGVSRLDPSQLHEPVADGLGPALDCLPPFAPARSGCIPLTSLSGLVAC